jgi:hypothetical protein
MKPVRFGAERIYLDIYRLQPPSSAAFLEKSCAEDGAGSKLIYKLLAHPYR